MNDAIRTGTGLLHGIPVALAVMEFGFMGGSMGSVVGEKLTRLIEYATQEGLTLLVVCTSGGARMQVGEERFRSLAAVCREVAGRCSIRLLCACPQQIGSTLQQAHVTSGRKHRPWASTICMSPGGPNQHSCRPTSTTAAKHTAPFLWYCDEWDLPEGIMSLMHMAQ